MKKLFTLILLASVGFNAFSQSNTTNKLQEKYNKAFSLFFYQNTLRMINQVEDKEFDELIKDIEKMKFLMIDKESAFKSADYIKLKKDYITEKFEEVMSTRHQGLNFDILLKEKAGKTQGMVVLVNDSSSLYVLDVVGSIALDKVTSLYQIINESSNVGQKIKNFATRNEKRKENDKEGKEENQ
ncbi:MAG: DUF4252 domain-containing protein [Cyclobacteriaceae bacterium]|nr:DUF4252 domain-containing protein [Cyclobacteriaceae bacterium]